MRWLALSVALCASACGEEERPAFPRDYTDSYTLVRGCRRSADHDLAFIRVYASPDALAPYAGRDQPFPNDAVLLKAEYDASDPLCEGEILGWTTMIADTKASASLGWRWQQVNARREVVDLRASCHGCHSACTGPPGVGYLYTCAEP